MRRHLARPHGQAAILEAGPDADLWERMFDSAAKRHPEAASGLVPYWIYTAEDGARIERHVPVLPLSRDMVRLERLRRSLAVYRMVFGQPRQEERLRDDLRIDLLPPGSGEGRAGS